MIMPSLLPSLFTFGTALLVALVLIPLFHLLLAPFWGPCGIAVRTGFRSGLASPSGVASRAGGVGVFLAVVALVPTGGDGIAVNCGDTRLALGMLLAAGLLVVGMTEDYRRLGSGARLATQGAFALTAACAGLQPAGVASTFLACLAGAVILVAAANALRGLDTVDGLAAGTGALAAAFLALIAHRLGAPECCDLNLGLSGALLTLLGFNLSRSRFKVFLGEGGCLAVGFLLGVSLLLLSAPAPPATRSALGLVLLLPLADGLVTLGRHLRRGQPQGRESRDHLHDILLDCGLGWRQTLILLWGAALVAGLATLRLLHLLA